MMRKFYEEDDQMRKESLKCEKGAAECTLNDEMMMDGRISFRVRLRKQLLVIDLFSARFFFEY